MFTQAITRKPGEDFAQGITTAGLGVPDYPLMLEQHAVYVSTLRLLELEVLELEPLPGFPDAYFVEDVAVVVPELAVVTNPGAKARKGEAHTIEPVLARYKEITHIQPPGTVDGGDVLMVGRRFFIGISERTNMEGAEQMGQILLRRGYTYSLVPVRAGLHLKSDVNYLGGEKLLVTEGFADNPIFDEYEKIVVEHLESYAVNTLWVNDKLITPSGFPGTLEKLWKMGFDVIELDVSEARKMDGGLTCMSLRF
jgi:dimethylargininase